MFKLALEKYNSEQDPLEENPKELSEIFGKTLGLYEEYSDILIVYKKTKFMQDLYNDIKNNVQKVKTILTNELEKIKN